VLLIGAHSRPPSYARDWHTYRINGTTTLHVITYIPALHTLRT